MKRTYAVVFEQAEGNVSAYVPDLPGCVSTGATLEEATANIQEAIQGHLLALAAFAEPIPEPSTSVATVEVAA